MVFPELSNPICRYYAPSICQQYLSSNSPFRTLLFVNHAHSPPQIHLNGMNGTRCPSVWHFNKLTGGHPRHDNERHHDAAAAVFGRSPLAGNMYVPQFGLTKLKNIPNWKIPFGRAVDISWATCPGDKVGNNRILSKEYFSSLPCFISLSILLTPPKWFKGELTEVWLSFDDIFLALNKVIEFANLSKDRNFPLLTL